MTPDLIAREIANGFWTLFPALLGLLLVRFGYAECKRSGRDVIVNASIAFGLFLLASVVMRAWVWAFLWQVNHDAAPSLRNDYWLTVLSILAGAVIGSYLVFRLTPPESGHTPWVVVLFLSLSIPLAAHFVPYLVGHSPWPAGWTGR